MERSLLSSADKTSDCDGFEKSEQEKVLYKTLSAPVTIQWELTPWCNERCVHCYNYWRQDNSKAFPSLSNNAGEILKAAASEIIKNKIFHVTLTGGEPLSVIKLTFPFLQTLHENNIGMDLNSNLILLNEENVSLLKIIRVRSILTSLMADNSDINDHLANRKGAFDDVTRGIRLAVKEGFRVSVSMVVTKGNVDRVYQTAKYVKGLGVTTFAATKASIPINAINFSQYSLTNQEYKEMLMQLLEVKEKLGLKINTLVAPPLCNLDSQELLENFGDKACSAGKATCTIGFDGSIRPCSQADNSYGNVLDSGGLESAWKRMQPWRTDALLPDECRGCKMEYVCRGGCRAESYAVSGSLKALNPFYNPEGKINIFSRKGVVSTFNTDSPLTFNPNIKLRIEDFGGIIYLSPTRWFAIDQPMYNFITQRKEFYFGKSDLATALSCDTDQVDQTLILFLKKGILQEGR